MYKFFDAESAQELLLTLGFIATILLLRAAILGIGHLVTGGHRNERVMFWTRQAASITAAVRVYNYTREVPFIWEEMARPLPYRADRAGPRPSCSHVSRRTLKGPTTAPRR